MKVKGNTDIGLVRATNEDTYVYESKDDNNFIAFVCDGMGGHLGGAFAASTTANVLKESYNELDVSDTKRNVGVWLFNALQKANNIVYARSLEDETLKGMGTTVSGIISYNGVIYYAHIGDSRIYVYNHKEMTQITTDHTYVNSLLLTGVISYKQALKHPKRHVLTNALGIKKDVSVDIGIIKLKDDENILICSDGLHNMLDEKKMLKIVADSSLKIDNKVETLIDKALQQGGTDNITLILVEQ